MTLTGYNQHLSNKSFVEKRDRKQRGAFVGYKNKLNINEDLATKDNWTKEDIEKRTIILVDRCLEMFNL